MSLDLEAIKARCEAATPGPWYVDRGGEIDDPFYAIAAILRDRYGDNSLSCGSDKAVAEFIVNARTDVPALVAEVEHLNDEIMGYQVRDGYDKGHEHGQAAAVAEVQRLRAAVAELTTALRLSEEEADEIAAESKAYKAEVERLREQVATATIEYQKCEDLGVEWSRRAYRAESKIAQLATGDDSYRVDL